LSESLTVALDEQRIAECVCAFLLDTFQGHATVALRDQDMLEIAAVRGFSESESTRLIGMRMSVLDNFPIADACRTNTPVVLQGPADFIRRYPKMMDEPFLSQDHASLSMPLRADQAGFAVG